MFSVLVIRLRSLRLLRVSGIVMRLRMFLLLITFLKASHSFRNRLLVICKNAYLTAYDVYPLDGRHDGGYYTVTACVTIEVGPRTRGNNVYVGFMVWSNFTATKCRGLVSLNQVIKEIICLQPLK